MDDEDGGGGHFMRCLRHPSQFFTGFCSFCLAERLSGIDHGDREATPPPLPPKHHRASSRAVQTEIVEISESPYGQERKVGHEGKGRKTLESLFHLDNGGGASAQTRLPESLVAAATGFEKDGFMAKTSVFCNGCGDHQFHHHHHHRKKAYVPSWWNSIFPKRVLRWRSASSKIPPQDPTRGVWQVPRHSWDGSLMMMRKAPPCSYSCLEEHGSYYGARSRNPVEDEMAEAAPRVIVNGIGEMDNDPASSANEDHFSSDKSLGDHLAEARSRRGWHSSNVSAKKSSRWSKACERSITSPLGDFSKKLEHVLERSYSESWRDSQKNKIEEVPGSETVKRPHRSNLSSKRSLNFFDGSLQDFRPDWLNRQRDRRFGRSRSVHYSSPGNIDSGLLRFYLTPMRSSRRSSTRKGVAKSYQVFGHFACS